MVYKDSLDEKKRHFHFGEFLHFQFGTNKAQDALLKTHPSTQLGHSADYP